LVRYLHLRERLRPYVRETMRAAHERGTPVMRPLFYDFPDDARAWEVEDQYMFGDDILVAPVLEAGARQRSVYLPKGADWTDPSTGLVHRGGQVLSLPAPIETLPLLVRGGRDLPLAEARRGG
jgi:alpha-D-xyloside xylohydrolase